MADPTQRRNKHLWRRVMGYGPQPRPVVSTYVDLATSESITYNLQETLRHRDYFEIKQYFIVSGVVAPIAPFGYGEYDEGVIPFVFSDGGYKTFNFNFTFSGSPYVVLTVDSDNEWSNINPFGITYSTTGAYIGTSAPYSGNIRYRAIYATSYPAIVSSAYTTSFFTASAGAINPGSDTYYYTTFGSLLTQPDFALQTAWDATGGTSDVFIQDESLTDSSFYADISAPGNNNVHFIVFDGVTSSVVTTTGFAYTFGFSFGT